MSKPIGKSSSVNPSGTNDAKTHGTSSKMGNLLAGMLEADPDFKKVVSRYMNRAGFDTTSSTAHPACYNPEYWSLWRLQCTQPRRATTVPHLTSPATPCDHHVL